MQKDKLFLENPRFHKFTFNDQVAEVFDDMVTRSVPFYDEIHAIILDLIDKYYKEDELIYDFGCSTGTTISLISNHLKKKKINSKFIGIDNSKSMILKCTEKLKKLKIKDVTLIHDDIDNIFLAPSKVIIMNYTLQFIAPKLRQKLINKIYKSLLPGGLFILSEKIKSSGNTVNELLIDPYHDYKKRNGYSELEIARKRDALENVLIPLTTEKELELLKSSGFKKFEQIFRWYNFSCFIGIK